MPITTPIVLTFTKEKETKNTFKYEEDERSDAPKAVGTMYLQKHLANGHDRLRVTITPAPPVGA